MKILSIIAIVAVVLAITAQGGFCDVTTPVQAQNMPSPVALPEKQSKIIQFVIAMVGVLLSSFVIYVGLVIYNKFFVDKRLFPNQDKDDVLNTPATVEQAVVQFIKRNKLC